MIFLCSDLKKKLLKKHHDLLVKILEPRFGLVQALLGLDVFSDDDCDKVKLEKTTSEKNKKLLELLLAKPDTADTTGFWKALEQTGQQHVVNYLNADGGEWSKTKHQVYTGLVNTWLEQTSPPMYRHNKQQARADGGRWSVLLKRKTLS